MCHQQEKLSTEEKVLGIAKRIFCMIPEWIQDAQVLCNLKISITSEGYIHVGIKKRELEMNIEIKLLEESLKK